MASLPDRLEVGRAAGRPPPSAAGSAPEPRAAREARRSACARRDGGSGVGLARAVDRARSARAAPRHSADARWLGRWWHALSVAPAPRRSSGEGVGSGGVGSALGGGLER